MLDITRSAASYFISTDIVPVQAIDGARSELLCVQAGAPPRHALYWMPAMGVAAKHYRLMAEAWSAHGVALALHEWRGIGSSNLRAGRRCNWGYRELLRDVEAGIAAVRARWPRIPLWIGGHSLGGQLAALYAGLHDGFSGIVLVASGAPYWRCFRHSWMIRSAYACVTPLAQLLGYLPGRRIGFGGNEARGVIDDWSRSGRTGRYAVRGMAEDVERHMAGLELPVLALRLHDDWLAPAASLSWLLDKMPKTLKHVDVITAEHLATEPADHFAWMKAPASVVSRLAIWMDEHTC